MGEAKAPLSKAEKAKKKADLKKKDKICKAAKGKLATCQTDCHHLFVKRPCPICGKGATAMMEAFPKVDAKRVECEKKDAACKTCKGAWATLARAYNTCPSTDFGIASGSGKAKSGKSGAAGSGAKEAAPAKKAVAPKAQLQVVGM